MKVMMVPSWLNVSGHAESGIKRVIEKYFQHLPAAGIELVSPKTDSFDLLAVHAGMTKEFPTDAPLCAHLHGLYWSSDYNAAMWEYKVNRDVIDSIRYATTVTVPSEWVSEPFRRDMHLQPYVLPHGIDWEEWQHSEPNDGYILGYAKNRAASDVCSPEAMGELARRFPQQRFLGTFAPERPTPNIKATGVVSHAEMKRMVQRAAVMVSAVKETFGVLHLEAMAAGVPVLGFRHGGILDTVQHGINGYLAHPNDYDDLAKGLEYCLKHRKTLGENGREMAKQFTWQRVAEQLFGIYTATLTKFHQPPTVTVVIPAYNYANQLPRAVESVIAQTYPDVEVIIVDNNSTDDTAKVARQLTDKYQTIRYINEPTQGVAHTRNRGIREATTKYIVPLDADDAIEPGFVATCVKALEVDPSLGIVYTRLRWVKADGSTGFSEWPGAYNYDEFLRKKNQVSTCCMFRKEMWQRLGGYRQRFAPMGAGAEDAEFFLRAGAMGWGGKLASEEALFVYSWGTGRVSGNSSYQEPDWLAGKPWIEDKQHPFASLATPANKLSHPVRQYDQPAISVVIPCSPEHQKHLIDALDSLEAQTFRRWEAIITFDGCIPQPDLLNAYPFVRWTTLDGKGAGAARNAGAKMARASLLLFLDADDWLRPQALQRLLQGYNQTKAIVYSDYAGHAFIEDKAEISKLRMRQRLESYNERTHEAVVLHHAFDYDCEEALQQPKITRNGEFYIWNLTTSLVPKAWHDEIGGFDESMMSWEDWDYWLRMARAGKCFTRIAEPLVDYRFYTGTRRESGRQNHNTLLEYMTRKYKELPMAGCSGCGGSKRVAMQQNTPQMTPQLAPQMSADSVVWVRLHDGNTGDHLIIGVATKTNYSYRAHGDLFKMVRSDAQAMPHKFIIVPDPETMPAQMVVAETPTPEPALIVTPAEFATWTEQKQRGRPKKAVEA